MKLHLVILTAAALCGGCIPVPHTTIRFPETTGRVVDAGTHTPIVDASVAIHDHPQSNVRTDAQGMFRVPRQKNFHVGYDLNFVCGPGDIGGKYWSYKLDISATGYSTVLISAPDHYTSRDAEVGTYVLKDILLKRE